MVFRVPNTVSNQLQVMEFRGTAVELTTFLQERNLSVLGIARDQTPVDGRSGERPIEGHRYLWTILSERMSR